MNKLKVKNEKYIDVTEEWLKNAKPNSHKVEEQPYFYYQGIRYFVDGKNVILDYSKEELEMAKWLENTFGGEIYMLPRINIPKGIKTADYLWNGEYWNLKTPSDNGYFNSTLERFIKRKNIKEQAKNFIINYNSFKKINKKDLIEVVLQTLNQPSRRWLNKIIIVYDNKVLKIFIRK